MNALRRFAVFTAMLFALLSFSGCSKDPSPSSSGSFAPGPDNTPDTSPLDTSPSDDGWNEPFPVENPVVPNIDWTENESNVDKTSYSQSYSYGGEPIMDAYAFFPRTSNAAVNEYYAAVEDDTKYRCDKLSSEAESLKKKGVLTVAHSYSQNYSVELDSAGLLSVRRNIVLNTGGAYPDAAVLCETFRVSDGEMLFLDDFFTVSQDEYVDRLLYSVRKYIWENKPELFDDAADIAEETFPYDSFCVTKNGLSLFYPEQTLAPQSAGVIRIDVPWEVFGDLWKMP